MGSGGNRSGGFLGLDKGELDCDVGLGLKMQQQQQQQQQQEPPRSDPYPLLKKMTPMSYHHHHHDAQNHMPPLTSGSFCGFARGDGSGGGHGGGNNEGVFCSTSNMYDVAGAFSAADSAHQRPIWAGTGLQFTAAQRQELDRQTLIFKYMTNSMPVPPELLIPISKHPSDFSLNPPTSGKLRTGGLDLKFSSGTDPEPWRCRRTDGKKWRCSRDVAPDQKYCERHTHKGKPSRSRKHVESHSHCPATTAATHAAAAVSTGTTSSFGLSSYGGAIARPPYQKPSFDMVYPPVAQYSHTSSRYPTEWFMKREASAAAVSATATLYHQQLDQMGHSKGDNSSNSLNTTNFGQKYACLSPLNEQNCILPRHFIDAWSLGEKGGGSDISEVTNKCPTAAAATNANLPLTLSMARGIDATSSEGNEDRGQLGDQRSGEGEGTRSHPFNWMSSWIHSTPGGPLAEALCLGMGGHAAGGGSSDELVSPHGRSSCSSTTTSSKSSHSHGEFGQSLHLH